MSDSQDNPSTHRMLHTRGGVVSIPRTQKGVPAAEYFQNADLPGDLDRAVVYVTEKGPVLGKPDPVAWNERHTEKARDYARQVKTMIDDRGYYSRTMSMFAGRLADETGHSRDEMKAVIVKEFEAENGKDPFTYLQDRRQERGLPVRNGAGQDYAPEQS